MGMDLTGILNQNEYYTNHYFSSIFEENAEGTISAWRNAAKEENGAATPWAKLRNASRQFYPVHDRYSHSRFTIQALQNICMLADAYLDALGYPESAPLNIELTPEMQVPVYREICKQNGAPLLWVLLSAEDAETGILEEKVFDASSAAEMEPLLSVSSDMLCSLNNEELATKALFSIDEPPRFLLFIGLNQIALIDRNKWNEKRYLQFDLEEIFSRREETTLQAMAVLLHKDSLCPSEGTALIDELDANSQKHAAGVSQDLKYALRECIELLGNEVLYDMAHRQGINLTENPVNPGELTIQCLRYMYRMLFVLFIEARPELGYAPVKAQAYLSGYSLESLRDIADSVRDDIDEVGSGYFLHETLAKLYDLIYTGYPETEEDYHKYASEESLHDVFIISPLKAHIFDPQYTALINRAKIRNTVMLRIVELMSLTRPRGRQRPGRISYANLGINQLGAVYEALLSYRGFIAEEDLYEVKRAGDKFDELDVGYFVKEKDLDQYDEDERVRYADGKLRMYPKGTFVYRLAGREREKSASYYTPEVLTKCLVKYALKELLEGKTADEILQLTICEPAMGSAAFLNEAINQLAEAYIDRKQKELGETIPFEKRFTELQKVKMLIADRNVYGIDLNPVAVELAEVSLWLNTIYEGGYVPWFGLQLVNGNSLIGARRQCYRVEQLQATTQNLRWYENAPERVPLGTKRMPKKQVYHFLAGDPGMCSYNDAVIKRLEPEKIRHMKNWNRDFTKPFSDDDLETALRLSNTIDSLWEEQIKLRKEIDAKTADPISVYGQPSEEGRPVHTTIREKDRILREIYKSEEQRNAGPYARLKFAMDYWCALWFWPIDKADLLPSRMEFLSDMGWILEGTVDTFAGVAKRVKEGQMKLDEFKSEAEELIEKQTKLFEGYGIVDIPKLCATRPHLALVREIAEQNHFMHWELEFADLFADRGGFDLIIGNPPWIKLEWNEQGVLSDKQPMFAVKRLTATQTTHYRDTELTDPLIRELYFSEYESISGEQTFLNASQNYNELRGQQTNLFKCFLPQSWLFGCDNGVSAFVHPEGVYDDPKGDALRNIMYPRLRRHFQFINEKLLFPEVGHPTVFSLNIYSSPRSLKKAKFHSISNLFDPSAIDQCYEDRIGEAEGIKDENGEWSIKGHPDRILYYGEKELSILSSLTDDEPNPYSAKLLALQTRQLLETIQCFAEYPNMFRNVQTYVSEMWHETYAQNDGILLRKTIFPSERIEMICSGPHVAVGNPVFKTPRAICEEKGDYDVIDISSIPADYMARTNYLIDISKSEYYNRVASVWGTKYHLLPKLVSRKMLNLKQERTFNVAIIPEMFGHINGLVGVAFFDFRELIICGSSWASIPVDFYIKVLGKANFNAAAASGLPVLKSEYDSEIITRGILLNSVTLCYESIYEKSLKYMDNYVDWSKNDKRLSTYKLPSKWDRNIVLRNDYERRQALVEIDVLTAMALGMKLKQLKAIYRLQFVIAKQYEIDTWYDANGRIVFTNNRSLTNVGFSRPEWENVNGAQPVKRGDAPWDGIMKHAPAGYVFARTITDDTMPGGPVERTIEYVAPFDRCDREQDYETAWKFFEEKYGKEELK